MNQQQTAESQLQDYLNMSGELYLFEKTIIAQTYQELSRTKTWVSNKDIIIALILKLETEKDAVTQDICRNALELIIQQTPGDLRL